MITYVGRRFLAIFLKAFLTAPFHSDVIKSLQIRAGMRCVGVDKGQHVLTEATRLHPHIDFHDIDAANIGSISLTKTSEFQGRKCLVNDLSKHLNLVNSIMQNISCGMCSCGLALSIGNGGWFNDNIK